MPFSYFILCAFLYCFYTHERGMQMVTMALWAANYLALPSHTGTCNQLVEETSSKTTYNNMGFGYHAPSQTTILVAMHHHPMHAAPHPPPSFVCASLCVVVVHGFWGGVHVCGCDRFYRLFCKHGKQVTTQRLLLDKSGTAVPPEPPNTKSEKCNKVR